MAYRQIIYDCGSCKDFQYTWAGNYGAKGETRAPRKKPTPEQIEKQNQRNKETRVRREMLLNFKEGDYWITLKYKKGYRPSTKQVLKDFKNFRTRLGNRYKARGQPLKYIYRIEIGKQGGVHIHFLVNDIGSTDKLVKGEWDKVQQSAGIYFTHAYEEGGFQALAEYVTKKPKGKALEQISLFPEAEQKHYIAYNGSRNLIRPEPETKEFSHWTMARILRDGPEPSPGYYIDKATVRQGVNPFTGYSYLYYTERRLDGKRGDPPWMSIFT